MTTSRIWKALLLAFVILSATVWILNQLGILSYLVAAILIGVMVAGLFFAAGAKFQQLDSQHKAKQQKRDEHNRIERLLDTDVEGANEREETIRTDGTRRG
jgi:predicted tellurium resistance membrane protein TerC